MRVGSKRQTELHPYPANLARLTLTRQTAVCDCEKYTAAVLYAAWAKSTRARRARRR